MIIYSHWLLGQMSQMTNNPDANVTGIQAGCTNTTDDIERWENEEFFLSPVSRSQPFSCSVYPINGTF